MRTVALIHLAGFLVAYVYGLVMAVRRRYRHNPTTFFDDELAITVLKPLRGTDGSLAQNLESFARLRVPEQFEVLLLVDEETDTALPVAREIAARYPHRFRVIVGTAGHVANPKMASLIHGAPYAKNDLLWVTDSNVEVDDAHLHSLMRTWKEAKKEGPALVHTPLVVVKGSGVGAALDRIHLAAYNNLYHELTLLVGMHAVVGKSLFMSRKDLRQVGGFEAFAEFGGEDYQLGVAFRKIGVVRCAPIAARQVADDNFTTAAWYNRHARWAVVRKPMTMPAYLLAEHFTYPAISIALCLVAGVPAWWLGAAYAFKISGDALLHKMAAGVWPSLRDIALMPIKEVLLVRVWLHGLFRDSVTWRGREMKVAKDGLYSRVTSGEQEPAEELQPRL